MVCQPEALTSAHVDAPVTSRGLTLVLTAVSTGLLVLAQLMIDRATDPAWLTSMVVLGALAVGTFAVSRAWARPVVQPAGAQPSAEGSVAGPT